MGPLSADAESAAAMYLLKGAIANDEDMRRFMTFVCESTINPCCKLDGLGRRSKLLKGPRRDRKKQSIDEKIFMFLQQHAYISKTQKGKKEKTNPPSFYAFITACSKPLCFLNGSS
jgi:hypothetical protein